MYNATTETGVVLGTFNTFEEAKQFLFIEYGAFHKSKNGLYYSLSHRYKIVKV